MEMLEDKLQLWKICKRFIKEQQISCGETIWQSDRVSENSLEFIEEICEIVGYKEDK